MLRSDWSATPAHGTAPGNPPALSADDTTIVPIARRLGAGSEVVDLHSARRLRDAAIRAAGGKTLPLQRGVINIRGIPVPVFDLALSVDQDNSPGDTLTLVLVTQINGRPTGVAIDAHCPPANDPAAREASTTAAPGKRMLIFVEDQVLGPDIGPSLTEVPNLPATTDVAG